MRPDALVSAVRRARIVAALRALPDRPAAARVVRALAALRRRPDAVMAAVLVAGVIVSILHFR